MATQTRARSKNADAFETGDLSVYGGIVSGFVSEYAETLDCTPAAVLQAVEAEGIDLYFDTAEQNGGKERDRPTAPEKRCLAMPEQELALLREAVENGHVPHVSQSDPEPTGAVVEGDGGQLNFEFGPKDERLQLRVSPATKAALAAEAEAQGETLSAVARRALRHAL